MAKGSAGSPARVDGSAPGTVVVPRGPQFEVAPGIRWFVRSFLVAFLVCSIFGVELWPLTGFRLFSRLRQESRTLWMADTVGPDGRESPLWFSQLTRAYQGFDLIMPGFRHLSPSAQRATCEVWLSEARRVRGSVAALRIYFVRWDVLPRAGDHPANPARRALKYACE